MHQHVDPGRPTPGDRRFQRRNVAMPIADQTDAHWFSSTGKGHRSRFTGIDQDVRFVMSRIDQRFGGQDNPINQSINQSIHQAALM